MDHQCAYVSGSSIRCLYFMLLFIRPFIFLSENDVPPSSLIIERYVMDGKNSWPFSRGEMVCNSHFPVVAGSGRDLFISFEQNVVEIRSSRCLNSHNFSCERDLPVANKRSNRLSLDNRRYRVKVSAPSSGYLSGGNNKYLLQQICQRDSRIPYFVTNKCGLIVLHCIHIVIAYHISNNVAEFRDNGRFNILRCRKIRFRDKCNNWVYSSLEFIILKFYRINRKSILTSWYEILTNLAMKVPFNGHSMRIELRAYKMHITKPSNEMIAFCRDICDSWQILWTNFNDSYLSTRKHQAISSTNSV